jgi:hypothetical protein
MNAQPEEAGESMSPATRRFVRIVIGFATLYGLIAAFLSFHIVVEQQAVRRHLDTALRVRPAGPFASMRASRTAAQAFVARLDTAFQHNPCGPGPAFMLAKPPAIPRRDCLVVIVPGRQRLHVRAYDTQGHRMDNLFERLNPPPRRL